MSLLRVMTLNIQGTWPSEGPNRWANRAPLSLNAIERHAPDLFGLQEAQVGNLEYFRQNLQGYAWTNGNCYGDNPPNEYTPIYWKVDRFDLLGYGEFWFSPTPETPSVGYGVDYPLGASWVKLLDRTTGRPLIHVNTHFEDGPAGAESRRNAARILIERMRVIGGDDLPVIATGDFNWNPGGEAHRLFLEAGYVDTFLAAGHADGAVSTFHGFEGQAYDARRYSGGANTFWRIDWVLVRPAAAPGARVASCRVVTDSEPSCYPSDHYPVIAEIDL
jgi:endonuclease/exonuclease/phosphatase family metal-dependent hydrolase